MNRSHLETRLRALVEPMAHGQRLPAVRKLMREFGVGQATMLEALDRLAGEGLVLSQVGRGTFVQKPGSGMGRSGLEGASVLLLSLRQQTARSHAVAARLHDQLAQQGARCLQIVYGRIGEAIDVLKASSRFDACVLQSYFEPLPLRLLAYLRQHSVALAVDGARLNGVDVDAVASDWRGAMDEAIGMLRNAGHRRIAMLTWPGEVQPLAGLRQHFESLRRCMDASSSDMPLLELADIPGPGESARESVRMTLSEVFGRPHTSRPTALLAWAGSDAIGLRQGLERLGLKVPQDLSVIVLGHVNRQEDHLGQFTIVGSHSDQAADALANCLVERLRDPQAPWRNFFLPNIATDHGSLRPLGSLR